MAAQTSELDELIHNARVRNANNMVNSVVNLADQMSPYWRNAKPIPRWKIIVRRVKNAWAALNGAEIEH